MSTGWIKRYTGSNAASVDAGNDLVVDPSGRVYATGESGGDFVTIRYNNSDGSRKWTKKFNGTAKGRDKATAIATDASGNVYVTGESEGEGSGVDFVTIKYNKDGSTKWTKRYSGPGNFSDRATGIAVDGWGNVYVTGQMQNDFLTIKYDKDGSRKWVKTYNSGANGTDGANALAVDASGNVYVTGFSLTASQYVRISDIATIKYSTNGQQLWVAVYNDRTDDEGKDIAVDATGNVYVSGFSGTGVETPDHQWATIKYNAAGTRQWVAKFSGPGHENGNDPNAMAIDPAGNVYVTGTRTDVSDGTDVDYATIKYNSSGVQQWLALFEGPADRPSDVNSHEVARDIAVDGQGNVYVTGFSGNYGVGTRYDYVTIKYNNSGVQQWLQRFNGTGNGDDGANVIALDGVGNVFVTGASAGSGTGDDLVTIQYKQPPVSVLTSAYQELNNLVVVYRHTNGGRIPDNYATLLHSALEEARLFYWRHSFMGLHIKWTVFVINDSLPRVRENGYVLPAEVDADLRSRGFTADAYDGVVAVVSGGGAYGWGVNLVLGKGGYCQVPWWGEKLLFSWFFVHEFHHVVDAMFAHSGHPEYPHNHPGAARALNEFLPHSGTDWDLNRGILQNWQRSLWLDLGVKGKWGTAKTFTDNDQDSIPDSEAALPLDETRQGSSAAKKDTDGDGLADLQEAMGGIFTRANPQSTDSDSDGFPDNSDSEPVYPLKTKVPAAANLTLAQDVTAWPQSGHYFFDKPDGASASLHLGYSASNLYVGVKIPSGLKPVQLVIDANNDGLFYGSDNIEVRLNGNTIAAVNLYNAAAVPAGDQRDFIISALPVTGFSGVSKSGSGWSSYQLVLPRLGQYGLNLTAGETLGVYLFVEGYGSLLEPNDYLTVTLGESMNGITTLATGKAAGLTNEGKLPSVPLQAVAYPNPFAASFTLQWQGGDGPVSIRITDASGGLVEQRRGLAASGRLQAGHHLRPGIYYAAVVQGTQRTVVKLIRN
ncbi:hypothetical protein V9K67_15330 [Paraflavisolibacter sp. H34]|uniref:hypothetical protein n=1 Tax=Huijunlia imazamoxiresistens TaxID=3127457 RepID=UPI003016DE86